MSTEIFYYLSQQSRLRITLIGLGLMIVSGFLNYLMGPEVSPSLLYLLPLFLTAWYAERSEVVLMTLCVALTWFTADYLSSPVYMRKLFPFWDIGLRLGLVAFVAYLLTALRAELAKLGDEERIDRLTGAASRGYFYDLINQEVERCRRYNRPFTVVYVKIDDFDRVVEQLAPAEGDPLGQLVAQTLKITLRSADIVARVGNDEFGVLLPETDLEPSRIVTRKLQQALAAGVEQKEWPVTFSMGAVSYIKPPRTLDEIVRQGDDLMYFVKKTGNNIIKHEVYTYASGTLK